MDEFLQQLLNGLALGGAYALFALSFTIVFGFLDIVNLGQAAILTYGAFGAYGLVALLGWPLWLGIVGGVMLGMVLGVAFNFLVFRPLRRVSGGEMTALVAGLGALLLLTGAAQIMSDTDVLTFPQRDLSQRILHFGSLSLPVFQATMLVVSVIATFALVMFFRRTKLGKAMRVVGWNAEVARLLGIPAERMITYAFALAGATAALAGVMIGLSFNYVFFAMGTPYLLKGLAAVILGGLGSIPGAVIGGLVIGIAEAMTVGYLAASWREGITFGILMLVLIARPEGIMGKRGARAQVL